MPGEGNWAEELLLLANDVYERRSGKQLPRIEIRRIHRPLEFFGLAARGADHRTNLRVNLVAARVEHELSRCEPRVLAPFRKLNVAFGVSNSAAAREATGVVFEGIAHVEAGVVFAETLNDASAAEFLASIALVFSRVKPCLAEQLGVDSPPFDAIVERVVARGAACTERVDRWTRKIDGGSRRIAFEYRIDETETRLTAILEDVKTGASISTAEVLKLERPVALRVLTASQSPRVNARDRTIEIRDRKRNVERVIRFGA